MTETTISNLTLNDLRDLIRTEIEQTLLELLGDPDAGLELRDDLKQRLQQSVAHLRAGQQTVPAQTVAAKLGLEW
jgi:hypothetical protein